MFFIFPSVPAPQEKFLPGRRNPAFIEAGFFYFLDVVS